MKIETLISTMNLSTKKECMNLLNSMNLTKNSIIINQCTKVDKLLNIYNENYKVFSFFEKGLSKSRNRAIEKSNSDICVIADDDLQYVDDFESIVNLAYSEFPDADIIAFYVENAKPINSNKKGRLHFLNTMRLCSVQLSLKLNSIKKHNIKFDENFGTGSDCFVHGEENIFLIDCLRKKLKIYYYPAKIATLKTSESTWFKGFDEKFFCATGAQFYRMTKSMYFLLILQFSIRKRNLYKTKFSIISVIKMMLDGVNKEKKIMGKC